MNAKDFLGYTPLHYAAWFDRRRVAALLLLRGARVNTAGNDGTTPLHLAVLEESLATIPLLLVLGADPNLPDQNGWTPFHLAAASQNSVPLEEGVGEGKERPSQSRSLVARLLEFRASPQAETRSGQTALHVAAGGGEWGAEGCESCRLLVEAGARVNPLDAEGRTPLDVSLERSRKACEEVLREAGGRMGLPHDPRALLLHLVRAIDEGDVGSVALLLELGQPAEPRELFDRALRWRGPGAGEDGADEVGDDGGEPRLELWVERGTRESATQRAMFRLLAASLPQAVLQHAGWDLFQRAAVRCDRGALDLLLEGGLSPASSPNGAPTPLHALCGCEPEGAISAAKALIAEGADPRSRDFTGATPDLTAEWRGNVSFSGWLRERYGGGGDGQETPELLLQAKFLAAVGDGDVELAGKLLKEGANPNGVDARGLGAPHLAARNGDVAMLDLLAGAGADLLLPRATYWSVSTTPLDQALHDDEMGAAHWLLDHGGLPKRLDGKPRSLADFSPVLDVEEADLLLGHGVAVDPPPGEESALEFWVDDAEWVDFLLGVGADPSRKGESGRGALHAAVLAECDEEILGLLFRAGADPEGRDDLGRTAAHLAAEAGDLEMLELLARAGADLSRRDDSGKTPQDTALATYQLQTVAWLRRWHLLRELGLDH